MVQTIESKFRRFAKFEAAEFKCPTHIFPKHSHDEFVIGANIKGRETVTLDRRTFEASTDQLTLYNPTQVQSSHANSDGWAFVSIYIRPSEFYKLAGVMEEVAFDQQFPTSSHLSRSLIYFVYAVLRISVAEEVLELELGNILIDLLELSGVLLRRDVQPTQLHLRRVAERLRDEMSEPPSLTDIASQIDTTPVALLRAFKKAYGVAPFEWLNVQRINKARAMLRIGLPLSRIAHELGYSDQPHFNRRFKAATGMTPLKFMHMK